MEKLLEFNKNQIEFIKEPANIDVVKSSRLDNNKKKEKIQALYEKIDTWN